jgi:hypothetical protein
MALPGCTAEASLYRTAGAYASRWAGGGGADPAAIVPSDLSKCGTCNCPGQCCEKEIWGCSCVSCEAGDTDTDRSIRFLTR